MFFAMNILTSHLVYGAGLGGRADKPARVYLETAECAGMTNYLAHFSIILQSSRPQAAI